MLEELFSSRVRAKVISQFFFNPGESFSASDLTRRIGAGYNAVWKELRKLEKMGILSSFSQGNAKLYTIDPNCPITKELTSLVIKTEGLPELLANSISQFGQVTHAFIFGSFASNQADLQSDIDLAVIGDVVLEEFSKYVAEKEKIIGRPINYVLFSQAEWDQKKKAADSLVADLIQSPKIMLAGDEHGI